MSGSKSDVFSLCTKCPTPGTFPRGKLLADMKQGRLAFETRVSRAASISLNASVREEMQDSFEASNATVKENHIIF